MAAHLSSQFRRACIVKFSAFAKPDAVLRKCNKWKINEIFVRNAGDHGPERMFIKPGSFQDWRTMRAVGFYALLTAVPAAIIITYVNVFIGEATYSEIPEDYVPEHWEYHKHPITRFVAKHFIASPQQDYEKMAHFIQIESEKIKERKTEKAVRKMMRQRGDGPWFYTEVKGPPTDDE
ncbi:NADH dehydrogenase [ubiquinone] 1 beta subcomplex subunit 5, mitochondrial-like [Apostichopus japonicus]|uniref:NADH dehydrogenase [ubiquinone] 1 beta subcomplex subunit 5, mitochondrial-like n=1 Tax=Stichopus japonicus TaxID=307972 RepID=UPI003AB8B372